MAYKITLEQLKGFSPCADRFRAVAPLFEGRKSVSLAAAAKADVPLSDLLWVAGKMAATDNRLLGLIVQFSLDMAGSVQPTDNTPAYWLQVVAACTPIITALIENKKPDAAAAARAAAARAAAARAAAAWAADAAARAAARAADAAADAAAAWAADAADAADAAARAADARNRFVELLK